MTSRFTFKKLYIRRFINNILLLFAMADNKIQMPSSGAGLTNFSDASSTSLHMTPVFVVGLCVAVIVITILLNIL